MLRWFEVNTNIWIWETIHAWIVFQISQKLCLRMLWPEMRLAPAHCHLAKRGAIWRSCENIMTVFDSVFSASYIQLRLSQVTFVVSLFVILPMYQHYVDENQMLTLWIISKRIQFLLCLSKGTSSSTNGSKSPLWSRIYRTVSPLCFKWLRPWPSSWSPKARNRQFLVKTMR